MTVSPPHEVLSHYPALATIQDCRPVANAGFSGAAVWRVETLAGPLALRRWPDNGPPADRLRGLHALLHHLHNRGLTFVAVPLRNRTGSTITRHRNTWWQLEPWLPGVADFALNPSRLRLTAAMQALARWHNAARIFAPEPPAKSWFGGPECGPAPAIVERTARLRDMLLRIGQMTPPTHLPTGDWRDAFRRLLAGCHSRGPQLLPLLEPVRTTSVPLQICLRDVWLDHVLFTGDTVTGLIDPSASRCDSVATDLARLLGSLIGDDAPAWDLALAAYENERPLSAVERQLIPLLDKSGVVLSAWTWIERLSTSPTADLGSPRLLRRLRDMADRLEQSPKSLILPP